MTQQVIERILVSSAVFAGSNTHMDKDTWVECKVTHYNSIGQPYIIPPGLLSPRYVWPLNLFKKITQEEETHG